METQKKKRTEAAEREDAAMALLEAGRSARNSGQLKILISWKLGRPCPSKISTVAQRQAKWDEVKDIVVAPVQRWSPEEEAELQRVKQKIDNITVDDTLLGRQRQKMQTEALSTVKAMSATEREQFLQSLDEGDNEEADNGDSVEVVEGGGSSQ
ncbi:hypothetical protein SEMRO_370_G128410.1 [Seminavis robusta]|uniref:Uncharacterized protein n=1 Tax=Seminavis robusta TaxID=568900 RepID=A0A9N8DY56_9STRA|nr:hypothetical protein SEMRO_370_G128410.1 [Seminavis robusta]|eukprot:Sro370_g128410.1 n/a (154) ;mRNA; f:19582-20043